MTLSPKRADIGIGVIDGEAEAARRRPRNRSTMRSKTSLVEVDQVDLVDRQHDVADAEQRADVAMAPGLRQHALARIDQDDGEVGSRGAGRHVARVLLVARACRRR